MYIFSPTSKTLVAFVFSGRGNNIQNNIHKQTFVDSFAKNRDTMIVMALNLENFDEVKIKGEELYRSLTEVHCPFFNDKVYFNAHGLQHLKFKRHGHARPRQDQYMRFKLLHLAPVILRNSKTLQGIWETRSFEKVRVHSRTDTVMKEVTYYEFVAVMENVRAKVIVKQVESGQRIFWSIIPFWGIDKKTQKRKLHSGYPVED